MNYKIERIVEVARALIKSNGKSSAGASTGELIAAAFAANHPEWAGYTRSDGSVDIIGAVNRLGDEWLYFAAEARNELDL